MIGYFCRANVDIDRMREASVDLVGLHDFRSFCKIDITNDEPTFMRRIKNVQISLLNAEPDIASSNPG